MKMSISQRTEPLTLLGIDLGKQRDHTAVALLERSYEGGKNYYDLTFLERLPLGSSYTAQVEHIKGLHKRLVEQGRTVALVVDRGGVGEGVVDLIKAAKLKPICVYMTAGHKMTRDGPSYNVPKKDIVTAVKVTMESNRLKIHAGLPYARLLISELEGFNYEINPRGHTTFGNDVGVLWREAQHDDLVLSVAFAVWYGERPPAFVAPTPIVSW
jgi:hypothetical protein